jgi:hypothetical protein
MQKNDLRYVKNYLWNRTSETQGPWEEGRPSGIMVYNRGWPSLSNFLDHCADNNQACFAIELDGRVWRSHENLEEWGYHPTEGVNDLLLSRTSIAVELMGFGKLFKLGNRLYPRWCFNGGHNLISTTDEVRLKDAKYLAKHDHDEFGGWYHEHPRVQIDALTHLCHSLVDKFHNVSTLTSDLEQKSKDGRKLGFLSGHITMPVVRQTLLDNWGFETKSW